MDKVLTDMIARYQCQTKEDYQNAFKEVIQDIALLGLSRAKFFEHAAFYGGTALRILHGLDRFSEDLDFILVAKNTDFCFAPYQSALENELASFGMSVVVSEKKKTSQSTIRSAFLKANTKEHLIKVGAPKGIAASFQFKETVKIKFEVDIDPCEGFVTETRDLIYPIPFWIRTLSLSSLFSGKLHAVLCRSWGERVKGRDWFDMLWFIRNRVPVKLQFLELKMRQTGHYSELKSLNQDGLRELLHAKIEGLNIERAREDVVRFIKQPEMIEGWSKGAFYTAVKELVCE